MLLNDRSGSIVCIWWAWWPWTYGYPGPDCSISANRAGLIIRNNANFAAGLALGEFFERWPVIRFESVGSGTRPVDDLALIQNIAPTSIISNRTTIRSVNVSNGRLMNVSERDRAQSWN